MTNHPSFQPSLRRENMKLLLTRLQELQAHEDHSPEYKAGFIDAQTSSVQLTTMMWQSVVIAADAVQRDFTNDLKQLEEEEFLGNDIADLADIARALLQLSVRLGSTDETEVTRRLEALAELDK